VSILAATLLMQGNALAADVFNGERIYNRLCIDCHGSGRGGQDAVPGSPNFAHGQTLMRSDRALLQTLRSGKNAMPSYLGVLDDYEMLDVIAYLRTIR
jgi:cytochrome c6